MGAGIAGLAAAWEIAQSGGQDVTILESERRPGGAVVTEQVDGFLVEGGPDGFLAGEPELPDLARELGIADRVIAQRERGTALWSGGGRPASCNPSTPGALRHCSESKRRPPK